MCKCRYETTATTLAACVDFLSSHPAAQARAHSEVDAVLKGKVGGAPGAGIGGF